MIAARRRAFASGSGRPIFAATVISRLSLEKRAERFLSCAPFRYMMFLYLLWPAIVLAQPNRGPADRHHQHGSGLAEHFIIDVDADHGVCPKVACFELEFAKCFGAGVSQRALVSAGAPTYDVPHACEQVREDVRPDNNFAGDDAQIVADRPAFDCSRSAQYHCRLLR